MLSVETQIRQYLYRQDNTDMTWSNTEKTGTQDRVGALGSDQRPRLEQEQRTGLLTYMAAANVKFAVVSTESTHFEMKVIKGGRGEQAQAGTTTGTERSEQAQIKRASQIVSRTRYRRSLFLFIA